MYKTYVFCLVASVAAISCNNSAKKDASWSGSKGSSPEEQLLKRAVEQDDYATAVVACNQILIKDSSRTDLYDSLAKYYIDLQVVKGAKKMVSKAVALNSKNYKMLEYSAQFDQVDGKYQEAYDKFATCYSGTSDAKYQYLMATSCAQMQDFDKADSLVKILISLPAGQSGSMLDAPTPQNSLQKVKVQALAYILKAKLTKNTEIKLQAEYVNKALEIQPDYQEALYIKQQYKF